MMGFISISNTPKYLQISDRTIESLQVKYKQLKRMSKHELSEAKRDLVQTGNRRLSSKTVDTLRDSNVLLQLRNRIGPTATGFQSPHCK